MVSKLRVVDTLSEFRLTTVHVELHLAPLKYKRNLVNLSNPCNTKRDRRTLWQGMSGNITLRLRSSLMSSVTL